MNIETLSTVVIAATAVCGLFVTILSFVTGTRRALDRIEVNTNGRLDALLDETNALREMIFEINGVVQGSMSEKEAHELLARIQELSEPDNVHAAVQAYARSSKENQ